MSKVNLETVTRKEFFERPNFSKEDVKRVLDRVVVIVDHMLEKFHGDDFPTANSVNYVYNKVGNLSWHPGQEDYNHVWTTSFWTGILWLMYEYTGDEKYKKEAQLHTDSFAQRIDNYYNKDESEAGLNHHDIGFGVASIDPIKEFMIVDIVNGMKVGDEKRFWIKSTNEIKH